MNRSTFLSLAAAASVAAASATPALAQDQWAQQVENLLNRVTAQTRNQGYVPDSPVRIGSLAASASQRFSLHGRGGATTMIVAVCDTDCSDMDMILYDSGGNVVARDVAADDTPIVTWQGGEADLVAEVRMVRCNAAPCRFAVRSYVKANSTKL
ncbi:MAG TPA: hypothetical protein VFW19_07825 [Allosphingosinicella sp.]|nr:hypothetical protein [Allosphingosinicella sp.]